MQHSRQAPNLPSLHSCKNQPRDDDKGKDNNKDKDKDKTILRTHSKSELTHGIAQAGNKCNTLARHPTNGSLYHLLTVAKMHQILQLLQNSNKIVQKG